MDFFGETADARVVDVDADVGLEKEQVDAVELDAIYFGIGGELEHFVEVNAGFSAGTAFADEAGPHGIVKFGVVAFGMLRAHKMRVETCKRRGEAQWEKKTRHKVLKGVFSRR